MTSPPYDTDTFPAAPREPSAPEGLPAPPSRAPRALRWLLVGVAASIVLLIALPLAMIINQEGLTTAIERDTPGTLTPEWMSFALVAAIVYAIVLHLPNVVLLLWLTPRILRGRRWARLVLTAYLIIATYFSLYSASKGGMFLWAVIPTDTLHILMIGLLWVPPSVRRFFAAHRAHDRARKETSND